MPTLFEVLVAAGLKAFFGALTAKWRERSTERKVRRAFLQWCEELPAELQFPSAELFLDSGGAIVGIGRNRALVRSLLRIKRIPTSEQWALALLEQWTDLKSGLRFEAAAQGVAFTSLSQPILHLGQSEVMPLLRDLGTKIGEVFAQDQSHSSRETLFAVKALEQQILGQGATPLARFKSGEDEASSSDGQPKASAGDLENRMIDNACAWLESGDSARAIEALETIKGRDWSSLSSHAKYRVEANLGNALLLRARHAEAASHYFAALRHESSTEPAKALEALAYLLVDDMPSAHRAAERAIVAFPTSSRAHMVRIRTSSPEVPVRVLEASIPRPVLDDPEVALALSERDELFGDHAGAIARVARALSAAKPWNLLTLRLGSLQLETIVATHRLGGSSSKAQIEEAIASLTAAVENARKRDNEGVLPYALMNRGLAYRVAGRVSEALSDTEEASRLAPANEQIVSAFAEQSFALKSDIDRAIDVLRTLPTWEPAGKRSVLLATLLMLRGRGGDSREALDLVELELPSSGSRPIEERGDLVRLAIELLHNEGDTVKAQELIDGLERYSLPEAEAHAVVARHLLKMGRPAEAKERIGKALANRAEVPLSLPVRLFVVQTLEELGLHSEAFAAIRQCVTPRSDLKAVALLLRSARRAGEDAYAMEVCDDLARAGIHTSETLGIHVEVLLNYSGAERALEIVTDFLAAHPGDAVVRLNLCRMAAQLGKIDLPDEVVRPLTQSLALLNARFGPGVVEALAGLGFRDEALSYGYKLWRRFPNDANCNRALVQALFLPPPPPASAGGSPIVVSESSAVRIASPGDSLGRWIVLEEEADQAGLWDEYPPSHALARALLGRSVGEQSILPGGNFVAREARVVEVLDKRVFRAQWVLRTFPDRFPESVFFESLDIGDDEGEIDPQKLLRVLQRASSARDELLSAYRMGRLPLTTLAQASGRSNLEVLESLASSEGEVLFSSEGSAKEQSAALEVLGQGGAIVVDPAALATLFLLRQHDLLTALPGRLIVCEGSIVELRSYVSQLENPGAAGYIGHRDGRIVVREVSEGHRKEHALALSRFVEIVESSCTVVGGRDLAVGPAQLRSALRELAMPASIESAAVAVARGAVLWTDDLVFGQILRNDTEGLKLASTRSVAQYLVGDGAIAFDDFCEIVLSLLRARFSFTSISAEIVVRLFELRGWETSNPDLVAMCREFENARWSTSVASATCLRTLQLFWRAAPKEFLARTSTARLLGCILERGDSQEILRSMESSAMPLLGLLPTGEAALRKMIEVARKSGAALL